MNVLTDYYQLLMRIASHPIFFAKIELSRPDEVKGERLVSPPASATMIESEARSARAGRA
jgi:hypothetical protein